MTTAIAYLGPTGTFSETAALMYLGWLTSREQQQGQLCPYPSISRVLRSVAEEEADIAIVPVENSIQGSVATTLDGLWELGTLKIQAELRLPVIHALLTQAKKNEDIQSVYSHPQALGQCQVWLETNLPNATPIATNSTAEALQYLDEPTRAAISSPRAAQLYNVPVLHTPINDYPDNCTRFWIVSREPSPAGNATAIAFLLPANLPGSLVKPLQTFASREINLTRIESRPTKRSLGEYLFFIELEGDATDEKFQSAIAELAESTQKLLVLGHYHLLPIGSTTS
ncbi:MAG: prephenate dehydratase [Cyanobacteria bacterium P01_H01_bin.15]